MTIGLGLSSSSGLIMSANTSLLDRAAMAHSPADHSRYRALLPAPQPARKSSPKKKRRLTRVACNNCRTKKLGCDGKRPCKSCTNIGTECVYISKDSSETPQMVLRREMEALKAERIQLQEIVGYLCASTEDRAQNILKRLRSNEGVSAVLETLKESSNNNHNVTISTTDANRSFTPMHTVSTVSDYEVWPGSQHTTDAHVVAPQPVAASSTNFTRHWLENQPWSQETVPAVPTLPTMPSTTMFEAPSGPHAAPTDWSGYTHSGLMNAPYLANPGGLVMPYASPHYDDRLRSRSIPYVHAHSAVHGVF